ncbi:MAG TPA: AI-2E family transporter [Fimbriimonas sp.]
MVGWRILLWALLVLSLVLFLYLVRGILLPFIVSFIIAALLEPTVRRLRLRGYSRARAVTLVMLAFYLFFIAAGVLVAPSVTRQVTNLTAKIEDVSRSVSESSQNDNFFLRWNPAIQVQQQSPATAADRFFERYGVHLERIGLPSSRRELMDQYVDRQRPKIAQWVQSSSQSFFGLVTNVFSQIVNAILIFLLVPMFLSDMEGFRRRSPRWIPPSIRESTLRMFSDIGQVFVRYLRGMVTVLLLFTLAVTVVLMFLQVPFAILVGALFGALYLIPYIGNIVAALSLFVMVGMSGVHSNLLFGFPNSWAYAALCTVIYLGVAWLFDHLIYPQMVGNAVGLSPVVSMFVIFCGGALFGLPGMLIAFPLAGSVKVILDRLIQVTSTSAEGLDLPATPLRHRSTA